MEPIEEATQKLKALYAKLPDELIVETIQENRAEGKDESIESYQLLLQEAKKRGLIDEKGKLKNT